VPAGKFCIRAPFLWNALQQQEDGDAINAYRKVGFSKLCPVMAIKHGAMKQPAEVPSPEISTGLETSPLGQHALLPPLSGELAKGRAHKYHPIFPKWENHSSTFSASTDAEHL
jgi:hypothetical protein